MSRRSTQALVLLALLLAVTALAWWTARSDADGGALNSQVTVVEVIDGDTIVVDYGGSRESLRLIGIDAPERDQCGYVEATDALATMVEGRQVTLVSGAETDRDRYDRLLRYVEIDGVDAGLAQIQNGFAVARYDWRTNQPHDRENQYFAASAAEAHICAEFED